MARLPQPGGDDGNWGTILNEFLSQAHDTGGLLKDGSITNGIIADGAVSANKLASSVQTNLAAKYVKPSNGIPLTDLKQSDLDTAYAPKSLETTKLDKAEAATKYAIFTANTVVIIGSSIEEQNGGAQDLVDPAGGAGPRARGWFHWANAFTKNQMRLVHNAGVGGDRYDQMLARFDTDVLTHDSSWVFIGSPTNSVTAGHTYAQIVSELDQMIAKSKAAGRRVLVHTVPPRDTITDPARRQVQSEINAYISELPIYKPGVVAVDVWLPLADPITGNPATGMTIDGSHPSIAGAARMGRATAEAVLPSLSYRPSRRSSSIDPTSFIANPAFSSNGAGWTTTSTVTVNYTRYGDTFGNKAEVAIAGNSSTSGIRGISFGEDVSAGRIVVGDILQASARLKWSNLVPIVGNTPGLPLITLRQWNGASVLSDTRSLYSATQEWLADGPVDMPASGDVILRTPRTAVKPNCTKAEVFLVWQGAQSVNMEWSEVAAVKNPI